MAKNVHPDADHLLKRIQLKDGPLGKYSLVPGHIERLQPILTRLENQIRGFSFSGVAAHTGEFNSAPVTAAHTGMSAPQAQLQHQYAD